jgi:hypothetical protein
MHSFFGPAQHIHQNYHEREDLSIEEKEQVII